MQPQGDQHLPYTVLVDGDPASDESPAWRMRRIGEWTLRIDSRDNLGKSIFSDVSRTPQQIDELQVEEARLVTILLAIAEEELNRVHDTRHSRKYWEVLLGRYIRHYVHAISSRALLLKEAIKRAPGPWQIPVTKLTYWQTPSTPTDFLNRTRQSWQFDLHLQTIAARALGVKETQLVLARLDASQTEPIQRLPGRFVTQRKGLSPSMLGMRTVKLLRDFAFRLSAGRVGFGFGFLSYHDALALSLLSGFRAIPSPIPKVQYAPGSCDPEVRHRLFPSAPNEGFDAAAIGGLRSCMPISFVEGFHDIVRAVCSASNSNCPATYLFPPVSDDYGMHWLAQCVSQGGQAIYVQHGGGYGEYSVTVNEDYERSISHRYVSWGWRDDDVEPLPSLRLRDLRKLPRDRAGDRLVWITQDVKPGELTYLALLLTSLRYQQSRATFASGLDPSLEERLTIRQRPLKYSAQVELSDEFELSAFEDLRSRVNVDSGDRPVWETYRLARLVVIDRAFSTSFLECLHLGLPAIVFDPSLPDSARPSARGPYQALMDVGVVFADPVDAAEQVARVFEDPLVWWRHPERKRALEFFRCRYALRSRFPLLKWARFIRSLP